MSEKVMAFIITAYDRAVTALIAEKYGLSTMEALHRFIFSETYKMLNDSELEMWEFGYPGIFDIWEVEQITGDPRNSIYLRGE